MTQLGRGLVSRRLKWCFYSPGARSLNVLLGNTTNAGGAEAQVAHLACVLAEQGHQVALVHGNGRGARTKTVVAGVECYDAVPAWRHPTSIRSFWNLLGAIAPDVLYARLPDDFLWLLGSYARQNDSRFVYALANDLHCQPAHAYDYNAWFHSRVYALGLTSADRIAIQHEGQRTLLKQHLQPRTSRVPNLVRSVRPLPRPFADTVYDAIWVAKIRPVKQLGRFLDLAEALPRLRFAVVGGFDPTVPVELQNTLEQRLRALPNVTFTGAQNAAAVLALIAKSRVLVNTSDFEGFPNTVLESWSAGVPAISLFVDPGGVIGREELGFVSGSMERLIEHVSELAHSEPLNRATGERALAYVTREHTPSAVINALLSAVGPT